MSENITPPSPPEGVIVSSSPIPTPTTPTQSLPMAQNMTNMESGGATNVSSWNEFFKTLNLIEVGFLVLGATSLYFIIYYYNRRTMYEKNQLLDIQKQLDEIKMNLRSSMKEKYKTI